MSYYSESYHFSVFGSSSSSDTVTHEELYKIRRLQFIEFPFMFNWTINEKHKIGSGLSWNLMVGSNYILNIINLQPSNSNAIWGETIHREEVRNTFLKKGFLRSSYSFHLYYQYNFKRSGVQVLYMHGLSPIFRDNKSLGFYRYYPSIQNPKRLQISWTYKLF